MEQRTGRIAYGLYNDILAGILQGEYPPQSTLPPETRLARDYGVSRTVVRSALDLLKREGVVRSRQGSGTVVAAYDPKKMALLNRNAQLEQLDQCFACRLAIEPEIAASVAQAKSDEAEIFIRDALAGIDAPQGDEVRTESSEAAQDTRFHVRMAELSGNIFFFQIMTTLRPHMLFAMNISKAMALQDREAHFDESRQEHRALLLAMRAGDETGAREAMREHLQNGRRRIFGQS